MLYSHSLFQRIRLPTLGTKDTGSFVVEVPLTAASMSDIFPETIISYLLKLKKGVLDFCRAAR